MISGKHDEKALPGNQDYRLALRHDQEMLALGEARHAAETSPMSIEVNPAWELVLLSPRSSEPDWHVRWQAAGDSVCWDGAVPAGKAAGRMVALKLSPIWQALGDGAGGFADGYGKPWPPFAFNSATGLVQVCHKNAKAFGLIFAGGLEQPSRSARETKLVTSKAIREFDSELAALFPVRDSIP